MPRLRQRLIRLGTTLRRLVGPRVDLEQELAGRHLVAFLEADADHETADLEFDHERTVPEDREADDRERVSKAQAAQLLRQAGYDPDDVLTTVGLPPMGWTAPAQPSPPAAMPHGAPGAQ